MLKKTILASVCLTIMQPAQSAAELVTSGRQVALVAAAAGAAAGGFVGGLVASRRAQANTLAAAGAGITGTAMTKTQTDMAALDQRIQALENAVTQKKEAHAKLTVIQKHLYGTNIAVGHKAPQDVGILYRLDALEATIIKKANLAHIQSLQAQTELLFAGFEVLEDLVKKQATHTDPGTQQLGFRLSNARTQYEKSIDKKDPQ